MHVRRALLTVFVLTGAFASAASLAQGVGRESRLRGQPPSRGDLLPPGMTLQSAPPESEGLSAQQAARQAQQRNGGGRVLSVDTTGNGWRVKLLKDGDVRFVFVPNTLNR